MIVIGIFGGLYLMLFTAGIQAAKRRFSGYSVWRHAVIGLLTPFVVLCAFMSKLGYWWARYFHRLEEGLFRVMLLGVSPSPPSPPQRGVVHSYETLQ